MLPKAHLTSQGRALSLLHVAGGHAWHLVYPTAGPLEGVNLHWMWVLINVLPRGLDKGPVGVVTAGVRGRLEPVDVGGCPGVESSLVSPGCPGADLPPR